MKLEISFEEILWFGNKTYKKNKKSHSKTNQSLGEWDQWLKPLCVHRNFQLVHRPFDYADFVQNNKTKYMPKHIEVPKAIVWMVKAIAFILLYLCSLNGHFKINKLLWFSISFPLILHFTLQPNQQFLLPFGAICWNFLTLCW